MPHRWRSGLVGLQFDTRPPLTYSSDDLPLSANEVAMRKIALYLLIALALGLSTPRPAMAHRPGKKCGWRIQRKVCPVSLRYRQQIQQEIQLPPVELSGTCPQQGQPSAGLVLPASPVFADFVLCHFLMRMQV